ncbi:tRNA A64-2'-O-ribosylphosphate transferase [Cytospora mali]|uniref:tRNA A64-2'-O-ribosylphosphate transferase n=1 Tax=Cytospora mali TaxID=578113 RepID=A0A194W5P4_CYTMA|nr:tRNA A64-2'-O-ribosylphosphate transferase [Valsa mali]
MSALSDLIFPSQESNTNINKILGDLKRSNLSITNRLKSIREDADFVEEVAASSGGTRPLVANERCGSWYIRPGLKGASAYFKSTDGHTGQWKFSTRRLNLHLLPAIEKHDGWYIRPGLKGASAYFKSTDGHTGQWKFSTRRLNLHLLPAIEKHDGRGKRMPDSLSKTIPTWCCVLNRTLFPDLTEYHGLYVPPNVVSDSEKSQMLSRVPSFVASFKELNLDLPALRAQISKPLRPTWVTQETGLGHLQERGVDDGAEDDGIIFESFRPVVCCTSSRRITDGEMSGHSGYVQGAGDDTENWALDLTPPVFWANVDELLSAPEADLPSLIRSLTAAASHRATTSADAVDSDGSSNNRGGSLPPAVRQLTPYIYVCPLPIPQSLPSRDGDAELSWCKIALSSCTTPPETWIKSAGFMEAGLGKHKAASRNLRVALPDICGFVSRFLGDENKNTDNNSDDADGQTQNQRSQQKRKRIIIADESGGKDLSIGVALALICCCFSDEEGHVLREITGGGGGGSGGGDGVSYNKAMIKVRLGRIMTTMPDANPNRATLQSVNSFLMDWR